MKTGELASVLDAELRGDSEVGIGSVRGVTELSQGCLTFTASKKFVAEIAGSDAAAVLVPQFYDELDAKVQLKVRNPQLAFARALTHFYVHPSEPKGIMEGAYLESDVRIRGEVTIYPGAYICSGAEIGHGTVISPNVYIGKETRVGDNCFFYPGVVVREDITIGNNVIIHPNAVIGADGYGFVFDGGLHHKIPQVGTVEIGDNVEIGAGTTIDRATTGATTIGEGTKIDNMVQIAHNVKIGKHCLLVAQVAIGGSTVIGDYVTMAGQVGVADHATVASGAMFGARAGIMGEVKKGIYSGAPCIPHRQWLKAQAIYEKLPELKKTLTALEEKVRRLEEKNNG